ncbi:restriction endonuclease [Microbispora sp. NBC_01389]|uniref:restriction endonuclease n=1 Tax=Microbispora sp. NBC_01389 TaxID=2903584 RepID=UPI0032483FA6
MARSGGGRSEWERQQAAQRREAERLARERDRAAKAAEKARQQRHVEDQLKLAERRTEEAELEVSRLDSILSEVLLKPPLSIDDLAVTVQTPPFNAGPLIHQEPAPAWSDFEPEPPKFFARLIGGPSRYERDLELARQRYEHEVTKHSRREEQRIADLAAARKAHAEHVQALNLAAHTKNQQLEVAKAALRVGEPSAVEWFVSQVLETSDYPDSFPRQFQVAYRPENHDVVIELELPVSSAIPTVRGYKYVKSRDAIDPVPRPATEIKQRYAQLLARVVLRTLHEVFTATSDIVEAVVLNGRITTIDNATGQEIRPHLISVEAERSDFAELVLARVDPAACLKRLHALVSPNPYDVEAIEPFITFDLKRFRFSEDTDVVASLDSRRNLLDLTPTEFEHLIRQLFIAMGAESWATVPSKDGGVDAVATSKNIFFGGVCLIQAKRWKGLVGLDAVHALTGVMADHNATTGVLVTPSWFGRASEQFAQRNRITLINGAELKHLLKEHLGLDVIPGVTPPRNARPSDNTQTGRPGS